MIYRSRNDRADSVMDLHTTGPGLKTVGTVHFLPILNDYHHNCVIRLRVRWCVLEVGEGFPSRIWPNILELVVMYSNVLFHVNEQHNDMAALCQYL